MVATKPAPRLKATSFEAVREKRWTPKEYERLAELGIFAPEDHVQLIDGVIYQSSPQKVRHANGIRRVVRTLRRAFGEEYQVDAQLPMAFGRSEPEPDVMVLPSTIDLESAHPGTALLVVEVSDTTLRFDRGRKMRATRAPVSPSTGSTTSSTTRSRSIATRLRPGTRT